MSALLEYVLANPELISYAITGITATVSYFFVAKTKKEKQAVVKKAFEEVGLHTEALDILTSSIEKAGTRGRHVKDNVTKDKPAISPMAEKVLHESIDVATGEKSRPLNEKEVEEGFKNWANRLLDKEK